MDNETIINIGFQHGQELVAYNFGDVQIREDMEYEEYLDAVQQLAWEADDSYRQYSPFEFLAHALNEREDADEAWDLYENAIHEGIMEESKKLTETDFNSANDELFGDTE